MILIDGKKEAALLREELKKEVSGLKAKYNKVPGLTVILIGDLTPSQIYVRNKEKSANEVGLKSDVIKYPDSVEEKVVLNKIAELNKDETVSGILVQLPLPKHIDKQKIIEAIDPSKDVDGFHAQNVGKLWSGLESLVPCTPLGCSILLKKLHKDLSGKKAIIIGRSNIVGKPMAALLLGMNATVTIAHSRTKNIEELVKDSDIVVAAVGIPEMVKGNWLKKEAIVIDVGINRIERDDKKILVGDVSFKDCHEVASKITPVPGGVGPMTIACLLLNTLFTSYIQFGEKPFELSSILD
jgi:methylenetetrahydrofolate dehydrogenase (NADP+)/methenyltetrahydrofolate cyclohydrolase